MTTELGTLSSAAANPFAAFMSPELVVAAHERLGSRVAGVIHRPLDKPRLLKAGSPVAAFDDEVDLEIESEFAADDDYSDILSDVSDLRFAD